MIRYTKEVKLLWGTLLLCGATVERRHVRKNGFRYHLPQWYITLPLQNYVNGPYPSKTTAVLAAADFMGVERTIGGLPWQ